MNNFLLLLLLLFDALNACASFFSPFVTFDNVRNSFTKRQAMFPFVLGLCFILRIFRCSQHYALDTLFFVFKHGEKIYV